MALTVDELRAYTNAAVGDDDFLTSCVTQATALVARFVGTVTVPDAIVDRAALEVGSELFYRRQAPSGITQFATVDGASAIRIARDPMVAAYPILTPWVGTGIA